MFWTWLLALPLAWQIILPIMLIVSVVIISIYGRVLITAGKKSIGIGRKGSDRRRDCVECSRFHRAEAAKVNRKIVRIESSIMKNKMNFVEQKLLLIKRDVYTSYSVCLKEDGAENKVDQMEEFGTRMDLILKQDIKDEIRRSIKENGFHEQDGNELNEYIKGQSTVIADIIEERLSLYYSNDLVLRISEAITPEINESVDSIYRKSREIELKALVDISSLEESYDSQLDEYVVT